VGELWTRDVRTNRLKTGPPEKKGATLLISFLCRKQVSFTAEGGERNSNSLRVTGILRVIRFFAPFFSTTLQLSASPRWTASSPPTRRSVPLSSPSPSLLSIASAVDRYVRRWGRGGQKWPLRERASDSERRSRGGECNREECSRAGEQPLKAPLKVGSCARTLLVLLDSCVLCWLAL
jgi:hypothetical protein